MRRAIARGRIVPQSLSTDPRMGQLSLKAALLFPLIWINCDDQGRISGNPNEIKYATCPNIEHIAKTDIPDLLDELEKQGLITVYSTSKTRAIQMLDWWEEQRLQWAYPSRYPAPNGWTDHLRYHPTPKEIITENWPPSGQPTSGLLPSAPASLLGSKLQESPLATAEELSEEIRSLLMTLPETVDRLVEHEVIKDTLAKLGQRKGLVARPEVSTEEGRIDLLWEKATGELVAGFEIDVYEPRKKSLTKLKSLDCSYPFVILRTNPEPLRWEQGVLLIGLSKERESSKEKEIEKETEKEKERGRGILPSALGSSTPSSLTNSSLFQSLTDTFPQAFGRKPDSRESAQLRDLGKEISSAGGATAEQVHDAFREAALQNKYSVSYVRAILLDWLGMERNRSP